MSRKLAKSIVLPTTLLISLSAWALSSSNPPGVNFPVIPENYKLTTFDSSGAQVDIDPLPATYYDNYFYTVCYNSSHCYSSVPTGAVIFKCPSGGDTTGATKYGRSELRELTNNWAVGDTFTNVQSGTVQVITQPGTASNGHTGRIIFAQIHGNPSASGSEMFKLRWNDGDIVAGVKLKSGDAESMQTLVSGVALKDTIQYTLTVVGTSSQEQVTIALKVTSLATGATRTTSRTYTYYPIDWAGYTLYFKAGSYNQDDVADGTQAVVAYSAFNVTHE